MKKFLVPLMLTISLTASAFDTEATPAANQRSIDFVVGKKAVENKNWQSAVDAFGRAVKSEPRNADIHNYLGYAYRNLDKMDLSFKHYNEALSLDPNHRGANEYIGWAYLKTGRPEKTEEHLARLEKICGKNCEEYEKLQRLSI